MGVLVFSDEERRQLKEILVQAPDPYIHPFEAQVFCRRHVLAAAPQRLAEEVHRLSSDVTAPGWLHVKNGPIGFVPDTPTDGNGRNSHGDFIGHGFLIGVMQEFGHILTNRAEKRGCIPADITPISGMGASKSSAGYSEPLDMHTENVHLPENRRPTYVGLYTLRGDPTGQAETLVTEVRSLLVELDSDTIRELREPNFVIKMSESFKNGPAQSDPMSVISGPADLPRITTEFNATICLTERARAAFNRLVAASRKVAEVVRLETGDLLVTCNRRTIHGRGQFVPDFSHGRRRWLLRVCTVADAFELRDLTAPGGNRAFDLTATQIRDMIAHCSGVLGIPRIGSADIALQDVRAAIKAYDGWLNEFGVPTSIPDLPELELIVFVARAISRGDLLKDLGADQRLQLALALAQHSVLEINVRGQRVDIDMNTLAAALTSEIEFGELLRVCLCRRSTPFVFAQNHHSEEEKSCQTN